MWHKRWRLGGCHNFVGVGGGSQANHSQVRRPCRTVCVYRRRPASMPDHEGAEGVILPSQLCVCGLLGSCAPGGDDRGGQGV